MHLALYTVYYCIYYYMHIIHIIIYAMRLCVCRRIIENEISSSVSHEGGSHVRPLALACERIRKRVQLLRADIVCVCVCVCVVCVCVCVCVHVCTPLTPLFATICPNYYCCDLISGLKSFLFSPRLSLSVFQFFIFIHRERVVRIQYAVSQWPCYNNNNNNNTSGNFFTGAGAQPLNDTGPAAVHRNICFCVTYPFGRRTTE